MSEEVSLDTRKRYNGHGPNARDIWRYVNGYGLVGVSLLKAGNRGTIKKWVFSTLCLGLETYIRIKQVNGRGGCVTCTKLADTVDKATRKDDNGKLSFKLFDQILNTTASDLKAGKCDSVEKRRLMWTTLINLKMWFENWKVDSVKLGLTKEDGDRTVSIRNDKLPCTHTQRGNYLH